MGGGGGYGDNVDISLRILEKICLFLNGSPPLLQIDPAEPEASDSDSSDSDSSDSSDDDAEMKAEETEKKKDEKKEEKKPKKSKQQLLNERKKQRDQTKGTTDGTELAKPKVGIAKVLVSFMNQNEFTTKLN